MALAATGLFVAVFLVAIACVVRVNARLRGEVHPDVSPEVAFAFVSDPQNTPQGNQRIHGVKAETSGPVTLGYRYQYEIHGTGRFIPCVAEVIEYQPGRRIVTASVLGGSIRNVFGYSTGPTVGGSVLSGCADARVSLYHALVIRTIGTKTTRRQPRTNQGGAGEHC